MLMLGRMALMRTGFRGLVTSLFLRFIRVFGVFLRLRIIVVSMFDGIRHRSPERHRYNECGYHKDRALKQDFGGEDAAKTKLIEP